MARPKDLEFLISTMGMTERLGLWGNLFPVFLSSSEKTEKF
jgi:hypothetical protein